MSPEEFLELVSELTDTQKLKVARLLNFVISHPEAREMIKECQGHGLDLDATVAELSRRLSKN